MSELAALLTAVASLLWPLLGLCLLLVFREDISALLQRITKARVLGHEFELDPLVEELREEVDQVPTDVPDLVTPIPASEEQPASDAVSTDTDDQVDEIIRTAAQSPAAAVLLLSSAIEKVGREVLASTGKRTDPRRMSLRGVVRELDNHYGLPEHVPSSLRLFSQIRNRVAHGRLAKDRDILSAMDSGISIYQTLRSLPRERHWVRYTDVPLYSDERCLHEMEGVRGVILTSKSPDGMTSSDQIFPSTATHFQEGKPVSWEWNLGRIWPETWYRDPDSNQIKPAWSSAGEFVGRHL